MDPISGNQSGWKMRRILELGSIRGEDDIAQEGKLGVNEGRAIHGGDHRDFDIKMIK